MMRSLSILALVCLQILSCSLAKKPIESEAPRPAVWLANATLPIALIVDQPDL